MLKLSHLKIYSKRYSFHEYQSSWEFVTQKFFKWSLECIVANIVLIDFCRLKGATCLFECSSFGSRLKVFGQRFNVKEEVFWSKLKKEFLKLLEKTFE